jgi:uncharacterized SAM-binding protein YcdF (DUF218 family)
MKRGVLVFIIILSVLVALVVASFFGLGFWLSPQSKLQKTDVIGAISGGDTAARTAEAVKLYQDGWAKHVLFSGAALDPNSASNAAVMARLAEAQGVPKSVIQLEEKSTTTQTNAIDSAPIIQRDNYKSIILVTSPYHQRRASIAFQRAMPNVAILNHSSIDLNWRRSHWWASAYSRQLTLSEFQKTVYELFVK